MQVRRGGGGHTGQVASRVAGGWEGAVHGLRKAHHAEEPGRRMVAGLGSIYLLVGMGCEGHVWR